MLMLLIIVNFLGSVLGCTCTFILGLKLTLIKVVNRIILNFLVKLLNIFSHDMSFISDSVTGRLLGICKEYRQVFKSDVAAVPE